MKQRKIYPTADPPKMMLIHGSYMRGMHKRILQLTEVVWTSITAGIYSQLEIHNG
jgi:hypothetical protein